MIFIIENLGFILQSTGALFVAYAALMVHHRVLAEHEIDGKVLHTMHIEQIIGWVGFVFLLFGFLIGVASGFVVLI